MEELTESYRKFTVKRCEEIIGYQLTDDDLKEIAILIYEKGFADALNNLRINNVIEITKY